ncbi:MAG: asparagine synthase (glutamine-hydrolyzing) [Planctomycetota bacterium]
MCGFVVVLNRDPALPVDGRLLERMTATLAHRGPDDQACVIEGNLGIGFRRLAVQDLSPAGRQPMRRGPLTLAMNGEVYNFQAERARLAAAGEVFRGRSDAEVLLAMLARDGVDEALRRAQGMLALALWDAGRGTLTLARDRLGQKPLYLWRGPERVVAASELKALLVDPTLERRIDPRSLASYLTFHTVPEPLGTLEGVEKLEPGTLLELDRTGAERRRRAYFDPAALIEAGDRGPWQGMRGAARELRERLRGAVASHLVADVPVGAFLSGGLDSAGVAALAQEALRAAGGPPLQTFCVAFRGSPLDESLAAADTARALGTEHHQVEVTPSLAEALPRIAWHLDEPFGIGAAAATYYLSRETRARVTVALSGDGADELFGGYSWRHGLLAPHQVLSRLPARARGALARLAPAGAGQDLGGPDGGGARDLRQRVAKWLGALGRDDAAIYADLMCGFRRGEVEALLTPELYAAAVREGSPTARFERAFRELREGDCVRRGLFAEQRTTLSHEMLAKVDRMSMAWGLEVRAPYLDDGVLALALALPSRLKVGARVGKRVLRRALAPLLPPAVLRRPKRGFALPLGDWFRGPLLPLARASIASLAARGLLVEEAAARILERHLRGPEDRGGQVYALVALEAWCAAVLDRVEVARPPQPVQLG